MYKRDPDQPHLQHAPNVIPDPESAPNTDAHTVDLALASDDAKRRRTVPDAASINDAQVALALQAEHDEYISKNATIKALQDIPAQFQAMQDVMQNQLAAIQNLGAVQNQMQNQFGIIQGQLATLVNGHDPSRTSALFHNSTVVNAEANIMAVPRINDLAEPEGFPATLGEFKSLEAPAVDALLGIYDLPVVGPLHERHKRLGDYLHLRID